MIISSKLQVINNSQQLIGLTLLDLTAAFNTIDHSILLQRLSSWFGTASTALSWIKSYLLNRSFYVTIENSKSSATPLWSFSRIYVLGPLLLPVVWRAPVIQLPGGLVFAIAFISME